MVSLFQAQAQAQASTTMAATKNGVYVNSVTISSILVEKINSRALKIQPFLSNCPTLFYASSFIFFLSFLHLWLLTYFSIFYNV